MATLTPLLSHTAGRSGLGELSGELIVSRVGWEGLDTVVEHEGSATIVEHEGIATIVEHEGLATIGQHEGLATTVKHEGLATTVNDIGLATGSIEHVPCRDNSGPIGLTEAGKLQKVPQKVIIFFTYR